MKRISLFRDREDYIKILTNDGVVNVVGTKGFGKTTTTLKYLEDDNYIVINCDRLFGLPSDEQEDKELSKIINMLNELYSCELSEMKQDTYMRYDEILSTLQLALGLDDDYQIDSILTNMFYKDPISFIQSFNVYGEDKDDYFVKNCQMLKACDILLAKNKWYLIKLENEGLIEKFTEEGIFELQQLAMNQMTRNFFNNLIIANEKYQDKLSLEDNLYFIELFSEYLLRSSISLIEKATDEYGAQESNMSYLSDTILANCKDTMFQYLGIKYEIDIDSIKEQQFSGIHNSIGEAPSVFSQSKQDYYDYLSSTRYYYDQPYVMPLQKQKLIVK